jgi:hypothetical protein
VPSTPGLRRTADVLNRWGALVLGVVLLVLAVVYATEGRVVPAVAWALVGAVWIWQFRRSYARPAVLPAHVDDDWARRVLADAGSPTGVPAVKALRDAEPALSLLQAKQLADRVAR